ncbi:DUF6541 family protein [Agromyces fucosus]
MSWAGAVLPLLFGALVLLAPGAALLLVLRQRGMVVVAAAPAVSLGMLAIATLALPAIGIQWSPASAGIVCILLVCAAVGVRAWFPAFREPKGGPDGRATMFGFAVGAVIAAVSIGWRLTAAIGQPENLSQTFDNVFHLNAAEYIVMSGDASPLTLSSLTFAVDGGGSFYPGLWHAIVALVAEGTGASIPLSANAVDVLLAALVWPLSAALLVRILFGSSWAGQVATGLVTGCFALFPFLLLDFGIVAPYALSVAALPAALAWMVALLGLGNAAPAERPALWIAAGLSSIGVALAHPGGVIALLVLIAPAAVVAFGAWWRRTRMSGTPLRTRVLALVGALVLLVGAAAVFVVVRPTREAAFWGPPMSFDAAFTSILQSSEAFRAPALFLSVAIAVGLIAVWALKQQRWLSVSFLLVLFIYVIVAALHVGRLRYLLTGTWYSDIYRIAALIPVVAVPLLVAGCLWGGHLLGLGIERWKRKMPSLGPIRPGTVSAVTATVLALVVAVLAQTGAALASASSSITAVYATTDDSALLSADERALLDRIADEVPADGVVVGNAWTGASLSSAIGQRRALVPHIFATLDPDTRLILDQLDTAEPGSEVCEAVRRQNVTHVLDFGAREVHGGLHEIGGLDDLDSSSAVELVDEQGEARLYRVVGCG